MTTPKKTETSGSKVTQTTITKPDGTSGIGYIKDGATYKDPGATQRVDVGTVVDTAGGSFVYNGPGNASSKVTKTTVSDATGSKSTGYIKDGATYTDRTFKTRVNPGSMVSTGGGNYYLGTQSPYGVKVDDAGANTDAFIYGGRRYRAYFDNNGKAYVDAAMTTPVPNGAQYERGGSLYYNDPTLGSVATVAGAINNYKTNIAGYETTVRNAADAQVRQIDARTQQQIREIEARKAQLEEEYKAANRASYNAYLNAINPYGANAQTLASLGLSNSGFAETSMVNIVNAYQNAINGNALDKIRALREINLAIDGAIAEGDAQRYQVYANMHEQIAQGLVNSASQLANLEMSAAELLNSNTWRERETAENTRRYEQESARADLELSLKQEISRSETARETATLIQKYLMTGMTYADISRILGVPQETLKSIVAAYYAV